ncbi:MAG: hypothetical protein V1822_03305 [Candidatus Micrarchaeota archaeon]
MNPCIIIQKASRADVPAILQIHNKNLLENLLKDFFPEHKLKQLEGLSQAHEVNLLLKSLSSPGIQAIEKRGYLGKRIDEDKFRSVIEDGTNGLVRVACKDGRVVGYMFAYNAQLLLLEEPSLPGTLDIEPQFKVWFEDFIQDRVKLLYMGQLAVDEPDGRGAGGRLLLSVQNEAIKQGYEAMAGVILLEPVRNAHSLELHGKISVSIGTWNIPMENGLCWLGDVRVRFLEGRGARQEK